MVVSGSIGALTESNGFYTAVSRGLLSCGWANSVPRRLGELKGKELAARNTILLVCAVLLGTVKASMGRPKQCKLMQSS